MTISKGTNIQQIVELKNVSTIPHPGLSTSLKPLTGDTAPGTQVMKELNYQPKQNITRLLLATFPILPQSLLQPLVLGNAGSGKKAEL